VVPDRTGILFARQEVDDLIEGVNRMENFLHDFDPRHAVEQAERFSVARFDRKMRRFTQIN
jgi:hypothetical protein